MNTYQFTGFITLVRKEVIRVFRIWTQTLLPSVITTTLYFLVFGSFIGARVGEFDSVPFIQFIIPGLIMMSVITNSYANVVSSVFSAKFQRNIEELLVSPLKHHVIILGYVSGGVIRGLIVGALVTMVSMLFSPILAHSIPIIISCVVLTALIFSLGGFINALFAKKFDDISIVTTFVLTPLTYLGGVFYSISLLPPFWQKLSLFNPILYLVNIFRFGFLGISDIPVTYALIGMISVCVILWVVANQLLKTGYGIRS